MDFPFAKTNCYLNSNKTPWIVKWPGVINKGSVDTTNLISTIDFMPTVLEAFHVSQYQQIEGRSFVPLLKGEKQEDRNQVFTQFYETSGRKRYLMFAIHDVDFCYIFNPWADGHTIFRNCSWAGMTFQAMEKVSLSDEKVKSRLDFFKYRIGEEFYNIQNDPDDLNNLIVDAEYEQLIQKYRSMMEDWMEKYASPALDVFRNRNNIDFCKEYMNVQENLIRLRNKKEYHE